MTGRFFSYQIFWKEYRQMRGFWLSVFGLTVMFQVIVYVVFLNAEYSLYGLGICFAALYALGCGATTFAMEHENDTYDFLRSLPTKGLPTFCSKMAFTLLSAPLLFLAAWASAALLASSRGIEPVGRWEIVAVWCVGSIHLFVWATLFSLLMRHVVKAAILGGLAAVLSVYLIMGLTAGLIGMSADSSFAIAVIGSVLPVAALDVWLGTRWYREAPTWPTAESRRRRRSELAEAGGYALESMPSKSSMFGHLFWLQWRQSRGMILILTAMVVPFLLGLLLVTVYDSIRSFRDIVDPFCSLAALVAAVTAPLGAASVFAGDQRQRQFRFLTDRGISPKLVWWSRHPIWAVAVMVWGAIGMTPILLAVVRWFSSGQPDLLSTFPRFPILTILCVALAYCFGQFCSMVFRSGILAGTFSVVGAVLLSIWAFVMAWLAVPLVWSVLPIPVILLVATRVRTRGWMLERNTIASWLPVVLILAVSGAAVLAGTCLYRAYQIPLVDPGFGVAAFTAPAPPEAQETARMYCRAYELMNETRSREGAEAGNEASGSPSANEEALALTLEASRRSDCDNLEKYVPANVRIGNVSGALSGLVLDRGTALQKQGDLDGAVECYLAALRMLDLICRRSAAPALVTNVQARDRALKSLTDWSAQPGQTKERILRVIHQVETLTSKPIPLDNEIKADYVRLMKMIDGDLDAKFAWVGRDPREIAPALMVHWMPWERERARRAVHMQTSNDLKMYEAMQAALQRGAPIYVHQYDSLSQPKEIFTTPIMRNAFPSAPSIIDDQVTTELQRRATRIQMALAAWQLDHKSLPENLDKLKGEYLAEVPHDPCSGEPFVYFPKGAEGPIERYNRSTGAATVMIEGHKPFFWSTGLSMKVNEKKNVPQLRYFIWNGSDLQQAASPEQIWAAGIVFPIPQPR